MSENQFFKSRLYMTGIATIYVWSLLIWDHFHGGVPSHHILAQEDMPSFSNWWGGLLIPLLTWFLLYRIQKRTQKTSVENPSKTTFPIPILYAFVGALIFGISLSAFFTFGYSEVPFFMLMGLLTFALFFPVYRAECFLGLVIGMLFTFGGVLPIIIISILSSISAVLYLLVRPVVLFALSKLIHLGSRRK